MNDLTNDSPRISSTLEELSLQMQLADFDESKHLKEREKPYCNSNLLTHGLFVIRETADGWWRESIDFKGDVPKQIEKLNNDPTVACGWLNQARFYEPGGWYDPS